MRTSCCGPSARPQEAGRRLSATLLGRSCSVLSLTPILAKCWRAISAVLSRGVPVEHVLQEPRAGAKVGGTQPRYRQGNIDQIMRASEIDDAECTHDCKVTPHGFP